jgi:hypothetical protein
MKITPDLLVVGALIAYIAFFTHPPPRFVSAVLENPVGQVVVLVGVVLVSMKKPLVGLFLGIAYLSSSYPVLEYMDESKPEKKEHPKSGAPKPDMANISKLAEMLGPAAKGGKLPVAQGKDEKAPPPPTTTVKPHSDSKVTEKFSTF